MTKFKVKDAFIMAKIIKKLDFKNNINTEKREEEVGKHILFYITENIDTVQDEISELIGSIFKVSKEEALNISLDELVKEFKNIGSIADFFQSERKLTK